MVTTLNAELLLPLSTRLREANLGFMRRYPGDSSARQPIHTVYGGAHLFTADSAEKLGGLAQLAGGFSQLKLDPKMIGQFVPVVLNFVQSKAGQQAMAQLLATGVALDAVFAASDLIALGAMKALRAHGLKVPEQVAVAGFDDIAMASFAQPGLSTVQQDTKLAGEVLVDSLIRLIQGETVESRTLPVKLVPRGSTHAG